MRLPSFRVRTLLLAVALSALLIWGGLMGERSLAYSRLAAEYGMQEHGWRGILARRDDPGMVEFQSKCVEHYRELAAKYRRATWRPWSDLAPDPPAPGWVESGAGWAEVGGQRILVFPNPGDAKSVSK